MDNWGKYLRAKEPGVREKAYAWKTAIGLQKVDGLTPSDYLIKTVQRNIEGKGDGRDPTSNPASNPTSKKAVQSPVKLRLSSQVRRLLSIIEGEMTRATLMKALGLKDRVTFMNSYLSPCLKIGLVEMTQPNSPRSPTQRYRLTAKGRCADV